MGYYIDPPNCSKEDFLQQHGARIAAADAAKFDFSGDALPVCLVDNRIFTAAAIGYSPHEVAAFQDPQDYRPKTWFAVKKDHLKEFMGGRI